jgi:spermidine synthase
MMAAAASRVAPLLFASGLCALVYQVAWLRELRLIFGASTAASAAVLAVFMGGLGVGGVVLGRRVDRNPLAFYANLELGVAAAAATTPLFVLAARRAYLGLGGAALLGAPLATAVRLVLAVLVLGAPTFLMGGTLPAAARAVVGPSDGARKNLATLYGMNTLGAVAGAWAANFVLIEVFGNRLTIWIACLVNALVGMFARSLARTGAPPRADEAPEAPADPVLPRSMLWFPAVAAAIAGFAFLLMELVWYRMLGPILGGSSYSFGLILCVALAGIGTGGILYGRRSAGSASLAAFAWTCALEAVFIAVPYALGDAIAILAIMLRPFGGAGFYGHVAAWTILTGIVVFPAAVVSGYQFPLVIALFGKGDARVARHVGAAYAANTVGAIVGSLAGGFGLLPALSAPGCWRLVVGLLAAAGFFSAALASLVEASRPRVLAPATLALVAVAMLRATGPTAAWRHSPIGAGRADSLLQGISKNRIKEWISAQNATLEWQADGVESSVAVTASAAYSFVVNGKSDGNARGDAPTQVMSGLIGAALLPAPRKALVIGLGTGSTAGWLAKVPEITRVDVAELEPLILRVARDCAPVNLNVLDDPKVHVTIGDAREVLLATRERYDLVFSEPSNPYRAGISSLYTRELYEAAARALTEEGIFLQWLQFYDIDGQTIRTAIATLRSVFPSVVIFQTEESDLLLLGSARPLRVDVASLRARLATEPFRSGMNAAWRMDDLEGFLAHHVASAPFAQRIAEMEGDRVNLDDVNRLEFAFARNVGKGANLTGAALLAASRALGTDRADVVSGEVDWLKVERRRAVLWDEAVAAVGPSSPAGDRALFEAALAYRRHDLGPARWLWKTGHPAADSLYEEAMFAEALADAADEEAIALAERVRRTRSVEADAILARQRLRQNEPRAAASLLASAFHGYRDDPWPLPELMSRSLELAAAIAEFDRPDGAALFEALSVRFSGANLEGSRKLAAVRVAVASDPDRLCARAFGAIEPNPPWNRPFLEQRAACYRTTNDPRASLAEKDLGAFADDAIVPLFSDLPERLPGRQREHVRNDGR